MKLPLGFLLGLQALIWYDIIEPSQHTKEIEMTAKSKLVQIINEGSESHDFGVTDSKGRAIGARVSLKVEIMEAAAPDAVSYYRRDPGTYYVASVQATRAGVGYGASFNGKVCTSEAERIAYVEKYLKSAKARALKTAGK